MDHFPGLEVLQLDGEILNNTSEDNFYNKTPFILVFLVVIKFKTTLKDHFCKAFRNSLEGPFSRVRKTRQYGRSVW